MSDQERDMDFDMSSQRRRKRRSQRSKWDRMKDDDTEDDTEEGEDDEPLDIINNKIEEERNIGRSVPIRQQQQHEYINNNNNGEQYFLSDSGYGDDNSNGMSRNNSRSVSRRPSYSFPQYEARDEYVEEEDDDEDDEPLDIIDKGRAELYSTPTYYPTNYIYGSPMNGASTSLYGSYADPSYYFSPIEVAPSSSCGSNDYQPRVNRSTLVAKRNAKFNHNESFLAKRLESIKSQQSARQTAAEGSSKRKHSPIRFDIESEVYHEEIVLSGDSDDDELTEFDSSSTSLSFPINGKRRRRSRRDSYSGCPAEFMNNPKMLKYWWKRYKLFSKFDEGIKLDFESWYSVTPEKIAQCIARRCCYIPDLVILDAFCGCGGNAIQFAKKGSRVIAVDIDPLKIAYAKHNASIYGVADRIEFLVGDYLQLAPILKADVVFLSPPWGGPEYLNSFVFDLRTMIPLDGFRVFELAKNITDNIAYFVPRTTSTEQLQELVGEDDCEIEQNIMDNRVLTITAYYGDLVLHEATEKTPTAMSL